MLSECHTTGEGDACAVSFAVMRVLVHGEKRPQLHHQRASLDLMQLVKKHQATKPLMPDPQKRFQSDGHQPPRGHQQSRGYQLPIVFGAKFICLSYSGR